MIKQITKKTAMSKAKLDATISCRLACFTNGWFPFYLSISVCPLSSN
jgi:hypothetical protein